MPGLSADCLETLEEIDGLNREFFEHAGGGRFRFVPCLNQRAGHVTMLAGLVERHLQGWEPSAAEPATAEIEARRRRAEQQASAYPTGPLGLP